VSLSDEAFDALTSCRRLCDADGCLELPGIHQMIITMTGSSMVNTVIW
jgi:hypothetical protein